MSKLTFTLALSNIFMTATPSYCSWRRSCQHQTDLLMRWCCKYATNYIIIKYINKFFLKSGSYCAGLFPWLFLLVVHRKEREIQPFVTQIKCWWVSFLKGNVYLEMKLNFFHLDPHKLGFHLKVSNFLSGRNVEHDIFEPEIRKTKVNTGCVRGWESVWNSRWNVGEALNRRLNSISCLVSMFLSKLFATLYTAALHIWCSLAKSYSHGCKKRCKDTSSYRVILESVVRDAGCVLF